MSSSKRVAIIGAGPSGLVAAKSLLGSSLSSTTSNPEPLFNITIFDKVPHLGGLWPISPTQKHGLVNPDMCVNQSRHTVSFSDLAWEEDSASFPKAWEVGRYLERYWGIYLEGKVEGRFGTVVVETEMEREGEGWRVRSRSVGGEGGEVREESFDYLLVATGFFGKEKIPSELDGVKGVPVVHSSKVRDIREVVGDVLQKGEEGKRKIVVVGGQMSGVETAAAIALQISSLANSPGDEALSDEWEKWTVEHVVEKPVWVMPLFFPTVPEGEETGEDGVAVKKKNAAPEFLPLDLVNYNLGWRPPGLVQNSSGEISKEGARMVHGFMENYIGSDQTEYGVPVLGMASEEVRDEKPMLAVSDSYLEFVRSGKIEVVEGRMDGVQEDGIAISMDVKQSSKNLTKISNIAAIISATGFDASASLSFLPPTTLQQLQFDPTSSTFPLALSVHATTSPLYPTLGFVGFYRSPYWAVMELQSRYLTSLWSPTSPSHDSALKALANDTTKATMLALRNNPRCAQFPMGDYAYLMESFASILGISRTEPTTINPERETRTGIVLPPRYIPSTASEAQKAEATKSLQIISNIFTQSSSNAKFVSRATFRALQGTWSLSRVITSQLATFPSGTLTGIAKFLPRYPTLKGGSDKNGEERADMEYLYKEEGEFRPSWGGTMTAKRAYVYHYTEANDTMDVWFAKGDSKTSDYFFHRVEFEVQGREGRGWGEGWRAMGTSHLCVEDMYNVTYEFFFEGTNIVRWTSKYDVKGPKKDYRIENVYVRR